MRMRAGLSGHKQTEETKNIISMHVKLSTAIQVFMFLDMEHVDLSDQINKYVLIICTVS